MRPGDLILVSGRPGGLFEQHAEIGMFIADPEELLAGCFKQAKVLTSRGIELFAYDTFIFTVLGK